MQKKSVALLFSVGVVAILVIGVAVALNVVTGEIETQLRAELDRAVAEGSAGNLVYSDLKVNAMAGKVTLHDVSFSDQVGAGLSFISDEASISVPPAEVLALAGSSGESMVVSSMEMSFRNLGMIDGESGVEIRYGAGSIAAEGELNLNELTGGGARVDGGEMRLEDVAVLGFVDNQEIRIGRLDTSFEGTINPAWVIGEFGNFMVSQLEMQVDMSEFRILPKGESADGLNENFGGLLPRLRGFLPRLGVDELYIDSLHLGVTLSDREITLHEIDLDSSGIELSGNFDMRLSNQNEPEELGFELEVSRLSEGLYSTFAPIFQPLGMILPREREFKVRFRTPGSSPFLPFDLSIE